MDPNTVCFSSILHSFSFLLLVVGTREVSGACGNNESRRDSVDGHQYNKLFVFGDSFADTGNLGRLLGRNMARSWFEPYGMSFPAKPAGRFSDGRVLTDFVASFMRIRSPIPYRTWRTGSGGFDLSTYGMNFAVAGSGVFDTGNFQRNLTAQLDKFQDQIGAGVFSKYDVEAAAALVAVSGNDYLHFSDIDPDYLLHLEQFMDELFIRLKTDLKRLNSMGIAKVMVTNLHPIQCTPYHTRSTNYTACPPDLSDAVADHNRRLARVVAELDECGASNCTPSFLSLDLNTALTNVLHRVNGADEFKYPLAPCCESSTNTSDCGQIDGEGKELYTVCRRPEEHFYWDSVHPTQAGWAAAFKFLRHPLRNFLRLY